MSQDTQKHFPHKEISLFSQNNKRAGCSLSSKVIDYSYANVSLTVISEALRAGMALATVARMSVNINQAIIPVMP